VRDLEAATGLHPGSLYKAHGSKEGLFTAAVTATTNRWSRAGCAPTTTAVEAPVLPGTARDGVSAGLDLIEDGFRRLLERARAAGDIAPTAAIDQTTMTTHHDIWNAYATAWSAPRPHRDDLLDRNVGPEVTYRDPTAEVLGRGGLSDYMHAFQQVFPGYSFAIVAVDAHHDPSLARWQLRGPDGARWPRPFPGDRYRSGPV
jgi:AcrR family transcriptional regulator